MKEKLKDYSFWVGVVGSVMVLLHTVNSQLNIEYIENVIMALLGVLSVAGIVHKPSAKTVAKNNEMSNNETQIFEKTNDEKANDEKANDETQKSETQIFEKVNDEKENDETQKSETQIFEKTNDEKINDETQIFEKANDETQKKVKEQKAKSQNKIKL